MSDKPARSASTDASLNKGTAENPAPAPKQEIPSGWRKTNRGNLVRNGWIPVPDAPTQRKRPR